MSDAMSTATAFGPFQVERLLGSGATAWVYQASHPRFKRPGRRQSTPVACE